MLEEIRIAEVATYPNEAQALDGLRAVNFVFGTNGSGKTTISRVIADPAGHATCHLSWRDGRRLETLVYNSDFVERNFTPQLRGIFTLGEAEAETLRKIEVGRVKIAELHGDLATLQAKLGLDDNSTGKRLEIKTLRDQFEAACWKIKTTHDAYFQGAFEGLRNSKNRFCDRVIHEYRTNEASLHTVEELKARAGTVYADSAAQLPTLPLFDPQPILVAEDNAILTKKVVGKEDVDIGALIRRLGNSDWVRQGLKYAQAGSPCPFCQKDLETELMEKLSGFFDEAYIADIAAIDGLQDSYAVSTAAVLERAEAALGSASPHIDPTTFRPLVDRLRTVLTLNRTKLERKRAEPSAPVALEPATEAAAAVLNAISAANVEIERHNNIVANLQNERTRLGADIWKCLVDEQKSLIQAYTTAREDLDKAVAGITNGIQAKSTALAEARTALTELERQVTSVQPTVTEINATLASFGFSSFKLETAGQNGQAYRIVRGDGTDARETLSEGERSFVTFLYFYHLVRGSTSETGITNDRVVVFDDPVSSLDSDVLFIVSALVKRILAEATEGSGQVKQIFVLTHNIYFHKEVSFAANRSGSDRMKHETFWTVRKVDKLSRVEGHATNPIKTSYELLWAEVRDPNRSTLTIQNVLRRILEHYFTILGGMDKDAVIGKFDGRDAIICASLFSWINDGSHNFADDLYVTADPATVESYLTVFKAIFEKTEHGAHYRMMYGPEPEPIEALGEPEREAAAQIVADRASAVVAAVARTDFLEDQPNAPVLEPMAEGTGK